MKKKNTTDLVSVKTNEEVLRAVYALNMCTVSVSQIIDYNDVYILEQEYEAILNNLNLERMPKADALKKILVELLNTITFFRIQEIRKDAIEKKYQQDMKNAIWSAIPNLSVIVSGDPVSIAFSLATQVGIGYMNYRKEKARNLSEKESAELELRIAALEQFHALRRELFTTAWELAEEYEFEDRLRLTEKQIKQYNQILIDRNELRKYARLEAIQDKFEAFPPFWYHFGHTASYIAGNKDIKLEDWEREEYRRRAKLHFDHYEKLNKFNILREDQMTAAFALEYVDLLLEESKPDKAKISSLIKIANEMSGNSLDVKQLCAIAFLKIGDTVNAANILKYLVNEEYNTPTNAKILSRIYVTQFLNATSATAKFDYKTLALRVGNENENMLYPMPERQIDDKELEKKYLEEQKIELQADYRCAINEVVRKYTTLFNALFELPSEIDDFNTFYGHSSYKLRIGVLSKILKDYESRKRFINNLKYSGYRFKYIDLLNESLETFDDLRLWRESDNHDVSIAVLRSMFINDKVAILKEIQDKLESEKFAIEDYEKIHKDLGYKSIVELLIDDIKDEVMDAIDRMSSMDEIDNAECDLFDFCNKHDISINLLIDAKKESKNG